MAFYDRVAENVIEKDNGYTAINAAFVKDLLARLDEPEVALPTVKAKKLRQKIIDNLLPLENDPAYEGGPPRAPRVWSDGMSRWRHVAASVPCPNTQTGSSSLMMNSD